MARRTMITLLATLALFVFTAASVHAYDLNMTAGRWNGDHLHAVGLPSPATFKITPTTDSCLIVTDIECPGEQLQMLINGQDKGVTSAPSPDNNCTAPINPEESMKRPNYSKGYYDLPGGTAASISLVMVATAGRDHYAAIMAKTSPCDNASYKIVTTAGKVRTRAAAPAACQAQGRVLAPVSSANLNDVVKVVRDSPDINLTVFDAVIIDSWNGDSYRGIGLVLVVSKFGMTVSMLVFPGYLLCAMLKMAMGAGAKMTAWKWNLGWGARCCRR